MNSICLQIFTKAPIENYCKTRLIPYLGKKETVQLQMDMIESTLIMANGITNADLQLWCAPSKEDVFFKQLSRVNSLSLHDQIGKTLGSIMKNAAINAAESYTTIVQIGTDCPYMDADYIRSSIDKLNENNNIVIGPANDGGYVLLAKNKCYPEIYDDIEWGRASVLQQLESNLESINIKYAKLNALTDIDSFDDFKIWKNYDIR